MDWLLQEALHTSWRTDEELVKGVRRGDDGAFNELFSRYRARIGAYVSGILGGSDRAEDIAQEVFISVLRRLRATECPIAFKPWTYQIAKNACIDELRRTRRYHEVPLDREPEADYLLSTDPSPDTALENKQQLDDLRRAFSGLSALHHQILVLRELEGLSYREIGERLRMSRPVVESTLFRARRRLAEEYEELITGRRCASTQAVIDAWEGRTLHRLAIRERRQLIRHLGHCQRCRRHAQLARAGSAIPRLEGSSAARAPGGPAAIPFPLPIPIAGWGRSSAERGALGRPGSDSLAVA